MTPIEEIKKLLNEESYAHLHECSCGCGTCGDKDPENPKAKGKRKLDEKPKSEGFEAADRVANLVEQFRRRNKVGVKTWRRMKQTPTVKKGKGDKISNARKARMAVRARAAHNRHR